LKGRTSDLSRHGCYFDTLNTLPVGAEVKVTISTGGRCFEGWAKVAYPLPGMGMGLTFAGAEAKQLSTLDEWLQDLRCELPVRNDESLIVSATASPADQRSDALRELVLELIRTRVSSATKGSEIMQRLRAASGDL